MTTSQAVFYGASGNRYDFHVFPLDIPIPSINIGGVYIFTRRSVDFQDRVTFHPLYIGQTNSFTQRLTQNHEVWTVAREDGFNTLCVSVDVNESSRKSSERDLINNYNPPYNLVHTHSSIL